MVSRSVEIPLGQDAAEVTKAGGLHRRLDALSRGTRRPSVRPGLKMAITN